MGFCFFEGSVLFKGLVLFLPADKARWTKAEAKEAAASGSLSGVPSFLLRLWLRSHRAKIVIFLNIVICRRRTRTRAWNQRKKRREDEINLKQKKQWSIPNHFAPFRLWAVGSSQSGGLRDKLCPCLAWRSCEWGAELQWVWKMKKGVSAKEWENYNKRIQASHRFAGFFERQLATMR